MSATVGKQIDQLYQLREKKRALESQVKEIDEQYRALEGELIDQLVQDGMTKATGKLASVSVGEEIRAQVDDWDTFYAFIKKKNAFYLLERRPANAAYRELLQANTKVPGVVPFTKQKLNLRTVKG